MEVNQVRFGNYSIGNSGASSSKKGKKAQEEAVKQAPEQNTQALKPEDVLSAMNMAGLHNNSQINFVTRKEVNPKDFLSNERIADIEAMMAEFESGVDSVADIIGEEFPEMSETNKNALAARVFAQE